MSNAELNKLKVLNEQMVQEAADLLAGYSEGLAQSWLKKPFARWNIARSFAGGFLRGRDPAETDPHPHASLILRVALRDREQRRLNAEIGNS